MGEACKDFDALIARSPQSPSDESAQLAAHHVMIVEQLAVAGDIREPMPVPILTAGDTVADTAHSSFNSEGHE
jgi:hypothetical protein